MPKAIVLEHVEGSSGEVYYPLKLVEVLKPSPKPGELLVRLSAAALNHRDVFIRQKLYPRIGVGVPLLADGVGVVVAAGSAELDAAWKGKRVILTPGRGWESSVEGPDSVTGQYAILGGTRDCSIGTLQEYVVVDAKEVEEAPDHLDDAQAAALPLAGLTSYRALFAKSGNAKPGHNILVTGIGGGVALCTLQLAVAAGCNVFVTSGSEDKLCRAKELGASGGVLYTEEQWEKTLLRQLPSKRKSLDAVIDGAGGDIVERASKILKPGGVIVSYGMTLGPQLSFTMGAVLKNIEVRGSTMGSRQEFAAMVNYVRANKTRPVVSRVTRGLEDVAAIDDLFDDMKAGKQFGKLVVRIENSRQAPKL